MIFQGDALLKLRTMDSEGVQCVVTSPPYWGLRDYGVEGQLGLEPTPEEYVEKLVEIFREIRRVLRDDGTLWINLGDCYNARRDGGHPGGSAQWKPEQQKYPRRSSVNVSRLKPKDLVGIPWRVAFALQADGWYLRSDIIWAKPNPMPESIKDRPTRAHEYLFLLSKSARYFYDAEAIRERATVGDHPRNVDKEWNPPGPGPRHSGLRREGLEKKDKQRGHWRRHEGFSARWDAMTKAEQQANGRNKRSVWTIATHPYPEAHFATFPEALVEPCVLAGSKQGDTVLDPFCGAGTTGAVALRLGREFIGIELNPEYIELAEKRLAPIIAQGKLNL